MKKIILVFLSSIGAYFCFAQTNVYFPLPSTDAVWRERIWGYEGGQCLDYQFTLPGDTMVAGNVYHKLRQFGAAYQEHQFCYFIPQYFIGYFDNYGGSYRNDSLNKKVYYLHKDSVNEVLLYDFNLDIYDTVPITYLNQSNDYCVLMVDSILIGENYHRRLKIGLCMDIFGPTYFDVIEGIGNTLGLLAPFFPNFESGSELICFQQNGMTVYPDTNYECTLVTRIDELKSKEPDFILFPNPVASGTGISVNYRGIGEVSVQIIDLYGHTLATFHHINNNSSINTGFLDPGIYLYKVNRNDFFITQGKLIVIR